jgi:hypothetical protein
MSKRVTKRRAVKKRKTVARRKTATKPRTVTKPMSDTARIDSYAKVRGWDPSMLPKPPPLMTRKQFRRFMKKLRHRKLCEPLLETQER